VNMAVCCCEKIIHSELLCYLQNFFNQSPRENIVTAIVGFYNASEIAAAKVILMDMVSKCDAVTDKPTVAQHKASHTKRKLDTDDILDLYKELDNAEHNMTMFVAAKLKRVPMVSPSEVDTLALATNVEELRNQVMMLTDTVKQISDGQQKMVEATHHLAGGVNNVPDTVAAPPPAVGGNTTMVTVSSWAQRVSSTGPVVPVGPAVALDDEGFQQVTYKRRPVAVTSTKVTGRRPGSEAVKAVPRPPTCFVGRLALETTEEDLASFLAESGILEAKCTKIKPKEGRSFSTSAFRVSCSAKYRDLFYDENNWPDGVDLRDWYFTN